MLLLLHHLVRSRPELLPPDLLPLNSQVVLDAVDVHVDQDAAVLESLKMDFLKRQSFGLMGTCGVGSSFSFTRISTLCPWQLLYLVREGDFRLNL